MTIRRISGSSVARQLGEWRHGRGAGFRQLAGALRLLILDGRIALGTRLPGERELALALGVSRTTVTSAYGELRDGSYLASQRGSGSVTRVPGPPSHRPDKEVFDTDLDVVDFTVANLSASGAVHGAFRQALEQLPEHLCEPGYHPLGLTCLREAIASRYCRRGCPTRPEQILVSNGAVHGFALVLKLLAGPGDRVVVDHPTYPHAIDAIQQSRCRTVPVGLGRDGWDVEALEAAFRQVAPRLAFLIVDFHNPTGLCMDEKARGQIAAMAGRLRTTIVVDETLAELWLDTPSPRPLAAFGQSERVISLGSLSKTHWGGLRVGWIRADESTIAAIARIRPTIDLGTPLLEQLAATRLLENDEDLSSRRARLRDQRERLLNLIARCLPDWRVETPRGGLSLWAELPLPVGTQLAASSEVHGVRVAAGSRFGVDGAFSRFVRLPFTLPAEQMELGITRLAGAYQSLKKPRGSLGLSDQSETIDEIF